MHSAYVLSLLVALIASVIGVFTMRPTKASQELAKANVLELLQQKTAEGATQQPKSRHLGCPGCSPEQAARVEKQQAHYKKWKELFAETIDRIQTKRLPPASMPRTRWTILGSALPNYIVNLDPTLEELMKDPKYMEDPGFLEQQKKNEEERNKKQKTVEEAITNVETTDREQPMGEEELVLIEQIKKFLKDPKYEAVTAEAALKAAEEKADKKQAADEKKALEEAAKKAAEEEEETAHVKAAGQDAHIKSASVPLFTIGVSGLCVMLVGF